MAELTKENNKFLRRALGVDAQGKKLTKDKQPRRDKVKTALEQIRRSISNKGATIDMADLAGIIENHKTEWMKMDNNPKLEALYEKYEEYLEKQSTSTIDAGDVANIESLVSKIKSKVKQPGLHELLANVITEPTITDDGIKKTAKKVSTFPTKDGSSSNLFTPNLKKSPGFWKKALGEMRKLWKKIKSSDAYKAVEKLISSIPKAIMKALSAIKNFDVNKFKNSLAKRVKQLLKLDVTPKAPGM